MSVVEANEAVDRFCDAVHRAASACKDLSSIQANREWLMVSRFLEDLRKNGKELSQRKALTKDERDQMIDRRLKALGKATDNG